MRLKHFLFKKTRNSITELRELKPKTTRREHNTRRENTPLSCTNSHIQLDITRGYGPAKKLQPRHSPTTLPNLKSPNGYIERDPARDYGPAKKPRRRNALTTIAEANFFDPYIERDSARNLSPKDQSQTTHSLDIGLDTRKQSEDDLDLPKNIIAHTLTKSGIDVNDYSKKFLESPELFKAMKARGFILNSNPDNEETKKEIQSLIHELNRKFIEQKPLIPTVDFKNKNNILAVTNKIASILSKIEETKYFKGFRETIIDAANLDPMTATDISKALSNNIENVLHLIPEGTPLRNALQGLKDHLGMLSIIETQDAIKQSLMKSLAHLTRPGAENNSSLKFTARIPFATAGIVEVEFEVKEAYKTSNTLSIKALQKNKLSFSMGCAIPLASITGGLSGTREKSTVTKSLERLVDDQAEKFIRTVVKMPIQGTLNTCKMKAFKNLVNDFEKTRNNTDQLSAQLRRAGIFEEGVNLLVHQEDTIKKLPKTRTIYKANPVACINAGITHIINMEAEINPYKMEVQTDVAFERPFGAMMEFPELLAKKVSHYNMQDIQSLNQQVDDLTKTPKLFNPEKIRDKVKFLLVENINLFHQYESTVRRRDAALESMGSDLPKQILKNMTLLENKHKHEIETQLGTKGRVQTFEKLITRHASLVTLYEKLLSNDLSRPAPQKKEIDQHLGYLDLSITDKDDIFRETQFKHALDHLSKSFDHPRVGFTKIELEKLRVITKVVNKRKSQSFKIDLSTFAIGLSLEVTRSVRDHFDPLRDQGVSFIFKLKGTIEIAADQIDTLVDTIKFGLPSRDIEANQALQALSAGITDVVSAGYGRSAIIEVEVFKGKMSYIRVLTKQKLEATAGCKTGAAGSPELRISASTAQINNVYERIGTNSFFYIHSQRNTLYSAQKLASEKADKDTVDGWTELAEQHAEQLASIIMKTTDLDSGPSEHLNKLVNDIIQYNTKNPEEAIEEIKVAIDELRVNAGKLKLQSKNFNNEQLRSSETFKSAVHNLREIFSVYGWAAIKIRKDEREVVIG